MLQVLALSRELEALQREKGLIIGVGYMLRYSPAVEVGKSWMFMFLGFILLPLKLT